MWATNVLRDWAVKLTLKKIEFIYEWYLLVIKMKLTNLKMYFVLTRQTCMVNKKNLDSGAAYTKKLVQEMSDAVAN